MAHTQDMPGSHGASGAAGGKITPEIAEAIAVGYEPHDVSLRGVFIFIVTLMFITLIVLGAMWVVMMGFVGHDRKSDPIASPVGVQHLVAPQPLQPSWNHNAMDREDMELMRKQTHDILVSSGTSPTGRRFISIDAAMDQVLPQLPIRAAVEPGTGGGTP
jgi:hypothetical protein